MKKSIIRNYIPHDDEKCARQFECHISDVMGGGSLVEVAVWEVRNPLLRKWWQSKTRYFGTKNFWVDDFPTIVEGIDACLAKLLAEEEDDNERRKKFEEFEKNS